MLRAFQSKARLPSVPTLSTAIVVGPRAIAASLETPCPRVELNPDRRELLFSAQDTTRGCATRGAVRTCTETISSLTNCCGGIIVTFLDSHAAFSPLVIQCAKGMAFARETDKARFGRFIIRDRKSEREFYNSLCRNVKRKNRARLRSVKLKHFNYNVIKVNILRVNIFIFSYWFMHMSLREIYFYTYFCTTLYQKLYKCICPTVYCGIWKFVPHNNLFNSP